MKKLFAIILITAAALGLSGCMVFSCEEHRYPRHAHAVYVPPRPPPAVVVVPGPGPRPHHHPPVRPYRID